MIFWMVCCGVPFLGLLAVGWWQRDLMEVAWLQLTTVWLSSEDK
jgi:hypothetical protein